MAANTRSFSRSSKIRQKSNGAIIRTNGDKCKPYFTNFRKKHNLRQFPDKLRKLPPALRLPQAQNSAIMCHRIVRWKAMEHVFPDYYPHFQCTAGSCRHSCCIGWEIDIDPESARYFRTLPGEFGDRLRREISWEDPPHFILGQGERCPFLNPDGLCDMILTLGEEALCEICTDHPRFRNELPGRLEVGLGLCCEEAARLILSWPEPVTLTFAGAHEDIEDEILLLRDQVLALLQNRSRTIPQRVQDMLSTCGAALPELTIPQWAEMLLELERLSDDWTRVLRFLQQQGAQADRAGFDAYMTSRQTEYEQFLVYLVYRHLANAFDETSLAARASFAALGYTLLHAMGAAIWTKTGAFPFEQQVELARLFSSEIEYSQDNMDALFDELSFF